MPMAGELRICLKCARSFKPKTEKQVYCQLSCFADDPERLNATHRRNQYNVENLGRKREITEGDI